MIDGFSTAIILKKHEKVETGHVFYALERAFAVRH